MMRVALISPLFESVPPRFYGGTERVVFNLCQGLHQAGVDVTLFASGDSVAPGELVPLVPESLRLAKHSVADSIPYNFRMLAEVARRADGFDVIHNHHDYWMLPLTRMTRTPVLTTLHGEMGLPHIAAAFDAFPRARYVSISDAQRAPMPQLDWVRTIHHGIDASRFEFSPRTGKYLAFLGRMSPQKRPDWAIEIAKRSGVPLKMAAKIGGPEDQEYFDARVKPHLDGRFIEYVGEICETEKSEFLGNALGLAFPIDWAEPFGLVMLESLSCGTPVLARPCGAAPEVLADGVTGYVDGDVARLADRVRELESIDRAGCRRWVEEKFSLKRMMEEYIDVYRSLALAGAARHRAGRAVGEARLAARHRRDFLHPVERLAYGNP